MTNGGTGGYLGDANATNHTGVTQVRHSQGGENLHPNRNHPQKKGDRRECGGFLDNSAKHDLLPERTANIVPCLFSVKRFLSGRQMPTLTHPPAAAAAPIDLPSYRRRLGVGPKFQQ
jgi:hypothetical protein